MSWTCLEGNRTIKAKKKHRCDVCDEVIIPGDTQVTRTGVSIDGFYRMHMHPECEEYSRDWDNGDWETHSPGDISREEIQQSKQKPQP